jgi:hypothetical protein
MALKSVQQHLTAHAGQVDLVDSWGEIITLTLQQQQQQWSYCNQT